MAKMQVEWVPIKDVHPYENNPRNNDDAVESVAASIEEFGWQQPIVVDKDGVIIAGHTRLKAAQRLMVDTVPVVKADDLTEEQVAAYRLADNKVSELAGWDFERLDLELDNLLDFDMDRFGFDEAFKEDMASDSFELPDNDEPHCKTVTLAMTAEQFDIVRPILDSIDQETCRLSGGNADGDRVCEVVRQWQAQKM